MHVVCSRCTYYVLLNIFKSRGGPSVGTSKETVYPCGLIVLSSCSLTYLVIRRLVRSKHPIRRSFISSDIIFEFAGLTKYDTKAPLLAAASSSRQLSVVVICKHHV